MPAAAGAIRQLRFRRLVGGIGAVILAAVAAHCGSPTNPGPVDQLSVQSISPTSGPASGGTQITIRGAGFAPGSTVTVGGASATEVSVTGSDVITARTPVSAIAGVVDIAVTVAGRTSTLTGGFRYEPSAPNTPPVIRSISAQGSRLRQPASYADYGETIRVSVVVEDAESSPSQLGYQWLACNGTFTGTGPQVDWTAPSGLSLPSVCRLDVTVSDGPHVRSTSISVRLHNSAVEVGALALQFLNDFADNTMPAATTVRNFYDGCPGKASELSDVTHIRNTRIINAKSYGEGRVTIAFGGSCSTKSADACVLTAVEWQSTVTATQQLEIAKGTSIISGVYRDSKWWLCDSLWDGNSSLGMRFLR